MVSAGDFGYIPSVVFVSYLGGKVINFKIFPLGLKLRDLAKKCFKWELILTGG